MLASMEVPKKTKGNTKVAQVMTPQVEAQVHIQQIILHGQRIHVKLPSKKKTLYHHSFIQKFTQHPFKVTTQKRSQLQCGQKGFQMT